MNLPKVPLVILDTETTGFVPRVHRIIEYASMRTENGEVVDEYEQLISIPTDVPPHIEALTRIRNNDIIDKPTFDEVRDEIIAHMGEDTIVVGQNVGFDINMLKGEEIDLDDRLWIDTSMLASLVFPEFASYSLGYMSQVLHLNHYPVHRALGDVRATTELLSACWTRLQELPDDEYEQLMAVMERAPEGYKVLFESLERTGAEKTKSHWINMPENALYKPSPEESAHLNIPNPGTVQLIETPLTNSVIEQVCYLPHTETGTRWIAVKNIHAFTRKYAIPDHGVVIHPPLTCLNSTAATELLSQEEYLPAEATLAVKLQWYKPQYVNDIPIHGDEKALWNGTLGCTWDSPEYADQFTDLPETVFIDHRQLLTILGDDQHPGHQSLRDAAHVIIDDASMLEDTSTKAYSWYCNIEDLRAASSKQSSLVSFLDILQIWIEKTRQQQDTRYITPSDLKTPEVHGLREQLSTVLEEAKGPVYRQLTNLQWILDPDELPGRIAWIEQRMDGKQVLQSVPEHIGAILKQHLYDVVPTTLLVPPGSTSTLREVLPDGLDTIVVSTEEMSSLNIVMEDENSVKNILENPPKGKTIILVGSKRSIEDIFINYDEELEEKNVNLICQSFSGGTGRMQAVYTAAEGDTIWVMTPWLFEGIEIPNESIDHLIIERIPFDHPAHTVLSKRSEHYRNPFGDYSLPRAKHRLYRLLRTYAQYNAPDGVVHVLDERLKKKSYGKELSQYITFLNSTPDENESSEDDQMKMF